MEKLSQKEIDFICKKYDCLEEKIYKSQNFIFIARNTRKRGQLCVEYDFIGYKKDIEEMIEKETLTDEEYQYLLKRFKCSKSDMSVYDCDLFGWSVSIDVRVEGFGVGQIYHKTIKNMRREMKQSQEKQPQDKKESTFYEKIQELQQELFTDLAKTISEEITEKDSVDLTNLFLQEGYIEYASNCIFSKETAKKIEILKKLNKVSL